MTEAESPVGGAQPIPPLDRDGGDWIGLPNQSGQGREAGWPRRVGSRALPGHLGAQGQWAGWPTFLSPAPSPTGPTVCILSGRFWKTAVCALWGGTEFQPWEALAEPCVALAAPELARQEQVDDQGSLAALLPGSKSLTHLFMSCGPMPRPQAEQNP